MSMQKGFASTITLIVAFLMIAVLATGVWYYFEYTEQATQNNSTEAPLVGSGQAPATPPEAEVEEGWVEFDDPATGFTFQYPEDAQIRRENENVGVVVLGPTQSQGTELYDGLTVLLATYPLNGKTLTEAAQAEQAREDSIAEVTEITPITYAGKSGFVYQATSLGTRQVIILPLTNDLYLKVTNSTVDPTGKGFQETAEKIASSVKESL